MLLKKKKCAECLSTIEDDWDFCPRCGEEIEDFADSGLESFFGNMEKRLFDMEKLFTIPEIKIGKGHESGGVSISIVSGAGIEPKVSIQTSGKFKDLEPEIRKQLGVERRESKQKQNRPKAVKFEKTEEPKMEVKESKNELTYRIKLPGIASLRSVDVKKFPNSVEIRAVAGNKLYFKLFEVPENFEIVEKSFKDGILNLTLRHE